MIFIFCQGCREHTEYLNINEASAAIGISRRTIYRWIEAGRLHLLESASGHKFVCKMSLLRPCLKYLQASAQL
ncbi:MAG: helix-turn-helix domain-containing protein [Blastocatellia bacterium]